jgi:hypothetical protein
VRYQIDTKLHSFKEFYQKIIVNQLYSAKNNHRKWKAAAFFA